MSSVPLLGYEALLRELCMSLGEDFYLSFTEFISLSHEATLPRILTPCTPSLMRDALSRCLHHPRRRRRASLSAARALAPCAL